MADIPDELPADGGDDRNYEVGYGKPPRAHRFKPGRSGNRNGRRKGTRNLKTHLHEELETKVTVTKDGKRRTMTKGQLMATQLINNAVKGHLKSIEFLFRLLDVMNPSGDAAQGGKTLTEEQLRMLMTYFPLSEAEQDKNGKEDGKEDGNADPR
jgi:hypothetical protein